MPGEGAPFFGVALQKDVGAVVGEWNVATVCAATFDTLQVDPATIMFSPVEADSDYYNVEDYNRDGLFDRILIFNLSQTGIDCADPFEW